MNRRLISLAALCLSACAGSTISTSAPVNLTDDEGLVAFVVMSNKPVNLISLRMNPDSGTGLSIPYTDEGTDVHVLKAKAGEYCLDAFHFSLGIMRYRGPRPCFAVRAGKLVYPGHLVVKLSDELGFHLDLVSNEPDAAAKIQAKYDKAIAGYEIELATFRGRSQ